MEFEFLADSDSDPLSLHSTHTHETVFKQRTRQSSPRFSSFGTSRPAVRTQASTPLFYQQFVHPIQIQQTWRPISMRHHSKKTFGRRAFVWILLLRRPSISTSPLYTWSSKTKAEARIKSESPTWQFEAFQTMESWGRAIESIGEDAVCWRRHQLSYLIFPTIYWLRSRDCFPVSRIMLSIEFLSTCSE